jgi:hypothetical protein
MSSEFERIAENQKALLKYLFPPDFCMGQHLQLFIIDYAFLREVKKYDKCWLRIGVIFSEDIHLWRTYLSMQYKRLYYELRIYTEKEGHVLSSFCLDDESKAIEVFELYSKCISTRCYESIDQYAFKSLINVKNQIIRLSYSPNDNCTYCVEWDSETIRVFRVSNKKIDTQVFTTRVYLGVDRKDVIHCCEIIAQRDTTNICRRLGVYFDKKEDDHRAFFL